MTLVYGGAILSIDWSVALGLALCYVPVAFFKYRSKQ